MKSKCSKGGEVAKIPLEEGGYMVLTTLPCFLKDSTGQKSKAAPRSQTSTPAHYMCHRFFSASGWWICSSHNYCTTQYYKIDALIYSIWRELSLRIDFFFQTSKSESYKEHMFQKKIPTEQPGPRIWYRCFHIFSFKFCTDKLVRCIPFTKLSKSSCTLFAVVMIINMLC